MKGVVILQVVGYLLVRAYTSTAQFPLENVAIAVKSEDGTTIALRLTDRSGRITPIPIPVPDKSESQSPDPNQRPFQIVNITARLQGYEQVQANNVQIFADTVTNQPLEMVPMSELPDQWNQRVVYSTPPQNL